MNAQAQQKKADFLRQASDLRMEKGKVIERRGVLRSDLEAKTAAVKRLSGEISAAMLEGGDYSRQASDLAKVKGEIENLHDALALADARIETLEKQAVERDTEARMSEFFDIAASAEGYVSVCISQLYAAIVAMRQADSEYATLKSIAPIETGGDHAFVLHTQVFQVLKQALEKGGNGVIPTLENIERAYSSYLAAAREKKS